MECDKKFNHDHTDEKFVFFNNIHIKQPHEIDDHDDGDFCLDSITSKNFLQDFHHLDYTITSKDFLQDFRHLDHFSSFFNPDLGIQTTNFFDPFNRFPDLESFQELSDSSNTQNFQDADGFLSNYYKKNTTLDEVISISDQTLLSLDFVVPDDQSSCVTADNIGCYKRSGMRRNYNKKQDRGGRIKTSKSSKGLWTVEEDRLLIHLVEKYGERKWSHIAQVLKGRIGKQCRERWHNHLRPDIKKDVWTEEEDNILIQTHREVGNKWAEIAKRLPGRTENSIKNHWNATKRRQFSRRKCRTKWPRPSSLLQDYIKSLNLEKGRKNVSTSNVKGTPCFSSTARTSGATEAPPQKPKAVEFSAFDKLVPENISTSKVDGAPCFLSTTTTNGTTTREPPKQKTLEFSASDDYDFNKIPEFAWDDELFEGSGMDSLIDDISNIAPVDDDDESCFDLGVVPRGVTPLLQCEAKKELDLMEMISQVNNNM